MAKPTKMEIRITVDKPVSPELMLKELAFHVMMIVDMRDGETEMLTLRYWDVPAVVIRRKDMVYSMGLESSGHMQTAGGSYDTICAYMKHVTPAFENRGLR